LVKTFEIPIIDVDETTAIDDGANVKEPLLVYPNPFNQQTTIKMLNNELINSIEVISLTSTRIKLITNIGSTEYLLNKDGLKNGIYYLKIKSDNTYFVKIVIQ
jgi:hypothetical protein